MIGALKNKLLPYLFVEKKRRIPQFEQAIKDCKWILVLQGISTIPGIGSVVLTALIIVTCNDTQFTIQEKQCSASRIFAVLKAVLNDWRAQELREKSAWK